jgi:hypothetical protein
LTNNRLVSIFQVSRKPFMQRTLSKVGLLPDRTNEPGGPQKQPARRLGYWPPTAARLSADTMDTLFWAGNDFAPDLKVDGTPVQEWLQSHYVNAMCQVALRMRESQQRCGLRHIQRAEYWFRGR